MISREVVEPYARVPRGCAARGTQLKLRPYDRDVPSFGAIGTIGTSLRSAGERDSAATPFAVCSDAGGASPAATPCAVVE